MAILPQLIVLQRYSVVENLTGHYVFFLGAYRGLYILNWVRAWAVVIHACLGDGEWGECRIDHVVHARTHARKGQVMCWVITTPPKRPIPQQIYRSYTEKHYHHDFVVYGCGLVQTALYVDFFYYYALRYAMNEWKGERRVAWSGSCRSWFSRLLLYSRASTTANTTAERSRCQRSSKEDRVGGCTRTRHHWGQ